jgi:hypothetical protein
MALQKALPAWMALHNESPRELQIVWVVKPLRARGCSLPWFDRFCCLNLSKVPLNTLC